MANSAEMRYNSWGDFLPRMPRNRGGQGILQYIQPGQRYNAPRLGFMRRRNPLASDPHLPSHYGGPLTNTIRLPPIHRGVRGSTRRWTRFWLSALDAVPTDTGVEHGKETALPPRASDVGLPFCGYRW